MPPKRRKNQAWIYLLAAVLCASTGSASEKAGDAASRTPALDPQSQAGGYLRILEQRIAAPAPMQLALNRPPVAFAPADRVPDTFDQQNFHQRLLNAHNRERQALGLVPLRWNPDLAHRAQIWADHLAATGRFEHAPENHAAPEGENLWAGTKDYYAPEAMVQAWIREKKVFRPGIFPDNSITGRVEDVGHYTQVVWRATTQVGCAKARSDSEDILVCRYAEAGNYRGETPF